MNILKPSHDLIDQQHDLEADMTNLGIARFRSKMQGAVKFGMEDKTVYGTSLLDGLMPLVVAGLEEMIASRKAGKGGPKGAALKYIMKFDDVYPVAFITLRLMLAKLSTDTTYTSLARAIGRAVADHHLHSVVREEDRAFYKKLADEAKKLSAYHVKRKVVNLRISRREQFVGGDWPERDLVKPRKIALQRSFGLQAVFFCDIRQCPLHADTGNHVQLVPIAAHADSSHKPYTKPPVGLISPKDRFVRDTVFAPFFACVGARSKLALAQGSIHGSRTWVK